MSDVEENDELSELPSSDPFRTDEIQKVVNYYKHYVVYVMFIVLFHILSCNILVLLCSYRFVFVLCI